MTGIYWSLRLARAQSAFRTNTPAGLDTALRLDPRNPAYHLGSGNYRRAAELSPALAAPWIGLGLAAEASGDLVAAEQHLLEAARRDHQFLPKWTLANFYFRQQRSTQFWQWAHDAAEINHDDLTALYRLCLATGEDPLRTLRDVVPTRAKARRQFLELALELDQLPAAGAAAELVAAEKRPKDRELLLATCDRLIQANLAERAVRLWNVLTPTTRLLTNGDFQTAPSGHGFDWRTSASPGFRLYPSAAGLAIEFAGTEDQVIPLCQVLALTPGRSYQASCSYQAELTSGAAPRWRAGQLLSPPLAPESHQILWTFQADRPLVELCLAARREPGQPRARGRLLVRNLSIQ